MGTRQGVLWRVPSPPLHLPFCSGVQTPQPPQDWVESLCETPARPWTLPAKTSNLIGVTAGAVLFLAPPPTRLLHLCPTITCLAFCQGTGSSQREDPDLTVGWKTLCLCPPHQAVKVRSHVLWALQAPPYRSNLLSSFCLDRHLGNQVWTPGRLNYTWWARFAYCGVYGRSLPNSRKGWSTPERKKLCNRILFTSFRRHRVRLRVNTTDEADFLASLTQLMQNPNRMLFSPPPHPHSTSPTLQRSLSSSPPRL